MTNCGGRLFAVLFGGYRYRYAASPDKGIVDQINNAAKVFGLMKQPLQFEWPADWPKATKGANCSPLLLGEAYEAFKRDIVKNGVYDKIHRNSRDEITQGRNRYRALRELGKTHGEIFKKYSVIDLEQSPDSDLLSNILRVHRSKPALVASYAMANPKSLKQLLSDREKGTKSGEARKVAAIVGCHANVITSFLDLVCHGSISERPELLMQLAADKLDVEDFMLAAIIKKTAEARNIEKLDTPQPPEEKEDRRVRVTPEKKEQIEKAHAEGKSKRAIAREVGLDGKTVSNVLSPEPAAALAAEPEPEPAPKVAAEPAPKAKPVNKAPKAPAVKKLPGKVKERPGETLELPFGS